MLEFSTSGNWLLTGEGEMRQRSGGDLEGSFHMIYHVIQSLTDDVQTLTSKLEDTKKENADLDKLVIKQGQRIAALEKAVSLDGEREGLARDDMEIRKALALVSRLLNRIFKGIRELRAFNNLVNFSDIKIAEDEAVEEIAKLAKER